ncbi:retrotransposon protein, putative, ty1-copia subclass [Tanacetum coccineum]
MLKGRVKGKARERIKVISLSLHPTKDDTCHHCKEVGHCKRNCPAYLAELIKKKKQVGTASSSDIFVIELFSFPTKSWVYDTSCGTHICNTKHGLRGVRKLKQVEAIGSFDLVLPNGLVICLDNCHYAPTITRGVVSVSRLVDNGFIQCFTDYGVSVSKNNVLYLMLLRVMVFKYEVENQLGKTLKVLRSDRGDEYISQEFKDYMKACGIVQQLTPPYTPQHNGVSERRNQTATRILNMVPTKKVDKTPYELWIPKETMGYYFYFPPENKIVVARYVELFEKSLLSQEVSGRAGELEEIQDEDTSPSEITSEITMKVEEVEEHSLGGLNEPANYKAAILYLK